MSLARRARAGANLHLHSGAAAVDPVHAARFLSARRGRPAGRPGPGRSRAARNEQRAVLRAARGAWALDAALLARPDRARSLLRRDWDQARRRGRRRMARARLSPADRDQPASRIPQAAPRRAADGDLARAGRAAQGRGARRERAGDALPYADGGDLPAARAAQVRAARLARAGRADRARSRPRTRGDDPALRPHLHSSLPRGRIPGLDVAGDAGLGDARLGTKPR